MKITLLVVIVGLSERTARGHAEIEELDGMPGTGHGGIDESAKRA